MKRVMFLSQKFFLSIVAAFALVVGTTSSSAITLAFFNQPKCPKHLLK